MNLPFLSAALQELIIKNKRVVLPGIGVFTLEEVPSFFLNNGKTITPPGKKINFTNSETHDDINLETAYTQKRGITQDESKEEFNILINKIQESIKINRQANIPGFGTIYIDEKYNFYFSSDKSLNICPGSYMLEPISLKPEAALETDNGCITASDEIIGETISENERKQQETSPVTEDTYVQQSDSPRENITEKQPLSSGDGMTEEQPFSEKPEIPVQPAGIKSPYSPPERRKSFKWLWVFLITIALIVSALVIIYIFREELQPILEKLLYTKEELEILKQAGQ